jgi:hypothetical protein
MSARVRLQLGIVLLVLGSILPLGAVVVAKTAWPGAIKAAVGGILLFGFEIMAIPAVAIMGKENYEIIMKKVLGWLKGLRPAGNISMTRHVVGLVLFLLPILPTYIMGYAPRWLPDNSPMRLYVAVSADVMFIVSLFVLGGDFWDKLRALFVLEAKAWFPGEPHPSERPLSRP